MANYQAAVNSISALFTTTKITTNNNCAIIANPQINYTNGFITDTLSWTKISGSFIAQGGEQYLTFGFFADTANLAGVLPVLPDSVTLGSYSSYYYLDAVSLNEVNDTVINIKINCAENIPTVFTPNNDGANDVLYFNTCTTILSTTIYNRWGNVVFNTDKQNYYWDGRTTSGEMCSNGTYFYILQTEDRNYKGVIQLIR